MRRTVLGCCARAASGHAAAELLRSAMNSRRLMGADPKAQDHGTKYSRWVSGPHRNKKVSRAGPRSRSRDPNWGGLLMENLQSLIAQLLGVAFAILGQLND